MMTEIEMVVVIEHFEMELSKYRYNSETLNYKGLRTIYRKKAEWLSKLLYMAKKQIPKKPTPHIVRPVEAPIQIGNGRWQKGTTVYKCPNCNEWVSKAYKHCPDCGQKLDWSKNI